MPRDAGGIYFLPAGNPVIPGTIIESDWANPTMSDIGQELSDSLSRSGKGGMLGPLRGLDGSAAVPTFSFTNEPSTGRFRAGPGQVVESVLGQPVVRYLSTGLEQWDSDIMDWVPLTPRDALGTPFDPGPSNLTSTNVQDAIEEVNDKTGGITTADSVSYDDSAVYFPASTVQQAIDRLGTDVSGLANDILNNADAIQILQGDFVLLENRVVQNEINIGNNTNNISLHDTRITNNENNINSLAGDISSISLEQITQNSRLTQTETNTANNFNITQVNADNISQNVNDINQNESDIGVNRNDIDTILGVFPGGILQVINGGTGVTTSTGSGSVVLNSSPTIGLATLNNPSLAGTATAPTVTATDDSTKIATTAHVKDALALLEFATQDSGQNGNGSYARVGDKNGTPKWILQWGNALNGNTGGRSVSFPISFPDSGNVRVMMQQFGSSIAGGRDWAPTISSIGTSSFTYGASYDCIWFAIGRDA